MKFSWQSLSPLILAACLPYLPTLTFLNLEVLIFVPHLLLRLILPFILISDPVPHSSLHRAHLLMTLVSSSLVGMCPTYSPSMWLELECPTEGWSGYRFSRRILRDSFTCELQGALRQLTFCILLSNRVSTEGVISLLVDHPNLITLEYERMKEGLTLLASSPDLAKRGFQVRKVVLESCREEDVDALEASKHILPLLEAISLNNSSLTPRLAISLGQFAHLEKLELGNSMFTQYTARWHRTSFCSPVKP